MIRSSWLGLLIFFVVVVFTVGCARPTYINIPPMSGDVAGSDPNAGDVRRFEVLAVRAAVDQEPLGGPYQLRLPRGSSPETYALVTHELGTDAVIPGDIPAMQVNEQGEVVQAEQTGSSRPTAGTLGDLPTVEVQAIRIRGDGGEVDVVRPSNSGRGLVTVHLDWAAGDGWAVARIRPWRIDPQRQPAPLGPVKPAGQSQRER